MGTVGGTAQGHQRDAPPSVHWPQGPPRPPHLALPRPAPPAPRPHPRLAKGARHPRRTYNHPGAHDVCDIRARLVAAGAAQRAGPSRPPSPRPRRRRPAPPPRRILSSAPPSAHPPRASPWSDRPPPAQRCCGAAGMWVHFGSRFRPLSPTSVAAPRPAGSPPAALWRSGCGASRRPSRRRDGAGSQGGSAWAGAAGTAPLRLSRCQCANFGLTTTISRCGAQKTAALSLSAAGGPAS